jgi:hypothetical protein
MSSSEDYNRGFDDGKVGRAPPYTGSFAEWQGWQAGAQQRNANAEPVATPISYPASFERVLNVAGVALAWVGFAAGAWLAFRGARGAGAGALGALVLAAVGGLVGAGVGVLVPHLVVGVAMVVCAFAAIIALFVILLVLMGFGGGMLG